MFGLPSDRCDQQLPPGRHPARRREVPQLLHARETDGSQGLARELGELDHRDRAETRLRPSSREHRAPRSISVNGPTKTPSNGRPGIATTRRSARPAPQRSLPAQMARTRNIDKAVISFHNGRRSRPAWCLLLLTPRPSRNGKPVRETCVPASAVSAAKPKMGAGSSQNFHHTNKPNGWHL
jgi:hypothetical protein